MSLAPSQLDLFTHVAAVFADIDQAQIPNDQLYATVAARTGLSADDLDARRPIGRAGVPRSVLKRQIRWAQQTLKQMRVIEHVPGSRGVWQRVARNPAGLHVAAPGVRLLAFSTRLGLALWGDCADIFSRLDQPIMACLTSPPYPLAKARSYGGPTEAQYVDFITAALEPVVRNLAPEGSICLNLGQDVFLPGLPSRSLYIERVTMALHDRLGLSLMDRLVWHNASRPPGPIAWASKKRVQLNASYDPVLWFCRDPARVKADNRRVLEPHSADHLRLIAAGGEKRVASYGDGAHTIAPGRYGQATPGRIPRNVLSRGHRCKDTDAYRRDAADLGLATHGAIQPLSIPDFLIRFLTEPGDLVVDPFGGSCTTGMAAERLGRRWVMAEQVMDYLRGAGERFRACDGFHMPLGVEAWPRAA
jgi:DNA modification methylase